MFLLTDLERQMGRTRVQDAVPISVLRLSIIINRQQSLCWAGVPAALLISDKY